MPVIAAFFGIVIRVYHSDHDPPHVHVQYGEFEAIVEIASGVILQGKLPKRVLRLLLEWLKANRRDVMESWKAARAHKIPKRVKPLE